MFEPERLRERDLIRRGDASGGTRVGMQQWRAFVRQQLTRLAEAGAVTVTAETVRDGVDEEGEMRERVLRYIAEPQSESGRSIVVPNPYSLLPPLVLPPRATRDLLAPYTIQAQGQSAAVNVPWSRVLRDHKQTETKPDGICLGCPWGASCPHGWSVPSPRSVVVLAVNDAVSGRTRLAWFVRFSDDYKKLVQVPRPVAKTLTWRMENDVVMCTSSLCSTYALEAEDEYDTEFMDVAHRSYARVYTNIRTTLKRRREEQTRCGKKAKIAPSDAPTPVDAETCLVCLEEERSAKVRCARGNCSAKVCDGCHHKSRGLCPICDRTAINADYPCASCGKLSRLQGYGLPCITCDACILCKECYSSYEECRPCEARWVSHSEQRA